MSWIRRLKAFWNHVATASDWRQAAKLAVIAAFGTLFINTYRSFATGDVGFLLGNVFLFSYFMYLAMWAEYKANSMEAASA